MKNKISTDKNSHITMLQWNLLTTDQFPFTKDNPGSSSHSLLDQIFIVKIVLKLKSNQKKISISFMLSVILNGIKIDMK